MLLLGGLVLLGVLLLLLLDAVVAGETSLDPEFEAASGW